MSQKRLNSTMVYARVHDKTVAEDYYAAMERVEQRLQIGLPPAPSDEGNDDEALNDREWAQLLDLAERLAEPELRPEMRIDLVDRMRRVLKHNGRPAKEGATQQENGRRPRSPPQPSPASSWVGLA